MIVNNPPIGPAIANKIYETSAVLFVICEGNIVLSLSNVIFVEAYTVLI